MKALLPPLILFFSLSCVTGYAQPVSEADQMKAALIGKTMGGREKCWKFQSLSQIKELVIREKKEVPQQRVCFITLKLQDARVPGVYQAEAEVTYRKVDAGWEIKVVGLKSLMKIE